MDTETGKKLADPSFLAAGSQQQQQQVRFHDPTKMTSCMECQSKSPTFDILRILSLEAGGWGGNPSKDDLLHPALNDQ